MKENNQKINPQLLVNFALSLQKKTKTELSAQELANFIANTLDASQRNKVLAALNHSAELMQQWIDINHTLGTLQEKETIQKQVSLAHKLIQFIKKPWLIPTMAMALGLIAFLPQLLQPNSQDLLDRIYHDLPQSQYESKGFAPQLDGSIPIDQQELFNTSLYFGNKHWRYYKNNHEMLKLPDLCQGTAINSCEKIQKIARQIGQTQGIVESSCYQLDDVKLWGNIATINKNLINKLSGLLLDFDVDMPDLTIGFCK